jgi:hypothetical protein
VFQGEPAAAAAPKSAIGAPKAAKAAKASKKPAAAETSAGGIAPQAVALPGAGEGGTGVCSGLRAIDCNE